MASIVIFDSIVQIEYYEGSYRISSTTLSCNSISIEVDELHEQCSIMGIENLDLLRWWQNEIILGDNESVQVKISRTGLQETGDLLKLLLGH